MSPRTAASALLPFALHAVARDVDRSVGVLLHTTLDLPDLVPRAVALVDPRALALHVAAWTAAGALAWAVLGKAPTFRPLYLRPLLTVLALVSLLLRPVFPYAFTLPVALTQDWGVAQDLAALATILALSAPRLRLPAPRAGGVFFIAFVAYALLTPERVRTWEGHPGNEPKYLRMGLSLGWAASLDVTEVSALDANASPMESIAPQPALPALGRALAALGTESMRMLAALPEAVSAKSIRATRLARQTIEGKQGGVFHVLAPGPSLLLAPTLRIDRAINLARGTPGRLAVSVLAWNAMGAALIAALFLLFRDATGRPGLSALLAGGVALTPPFLFYFFQFYPEMPGALLVTVALRGLLFGGRWKTRDATLMGLALAALPWLHQKFLPVWAIFAVMAVGKLVDELATLRALLGFVLPQAATLFLFALLNFGITGSLRPDALFLAWGPAGIQSTHLGEGILGLLFDARYGLVPYVPVCLFALGGVGSAAWPRLRWALPPVLAYYLTVAAADNWSGSVCNLGRYIMPALPLLLALVAAALARTGPRRGVVAAFAILAAVTGVFAQRLWQDPRAANDSALLLGNSAFGDGNVYVPNLFFRTWNSIHHPGQPARVAAWILAALVLGWWLDRVARARGGDSPWRALQGVTVFVLMAGFALELWPPPSTTARLQDGIEVAPGVVAFVSGAEVAGDLVRSGPGDVRLLVRARSPIEGLSLAVEGAGRIRWAGHAPTPIPERGLDIDLPLAPLLSLTGRRGAAETFSTQTLEIETSGEVHIRLGMRRGAS